MHSKQLMLHQDALCESFGKYELWMLTCTAADWKPLITAVCVTCWIQAKFAKPLNSSLYADCMINVTSASVNHSEWSSQCRMFRGHGAGGALGLMSSIPTQKGCTINHISITIMVFGPSLLINWARTLLKLGNWLMTMPSVGDHIPQYERFWSVPVLGAEWHQSKL